MLQQRCDCPSKSSFLTILLVEPLNHSTFARRHLIEMQMGKIQKAGDFSLAARISMVQPCRCVPSVSFIHIYVHMQLVHTYIQWIYMYCVHSYIYLVSTGVSCCQEATRKHQSSRLKKIQQQLGTYRQWPSRTVIRHNTDKEDIEGRNTN